MKSFYTYSTSVVLALCLLASGTSSEANAQSSKRTALSVSYFGEFIGHPGIRVGLERPISGSQKPGQRHDLLLLGTNLGVYHHTQNHTGIMLDAEIGYRFVTKGGFKAETYLGFGYHRSFLDGPVFTVSPANDVERVRFAGQNTAFVSWSFGVGHQIKNSPISWHIRPGLFVRAPHNSSALAHVFAEVGVSYRLNHFKLF